MLDQLTNLVKNQAMEYMKGSDEKLTDEQMNGVADVAQESVVGGLKEELMAGNVSGIQGLLTGGASGLTGNPIVSKIVNMFSGNLVSKLGIGSVLAGGLAGGMIPKIMGSLGSKVQSDDPANSGFSMDALTGLAGGAGAAGGLGGLINKVTGGAGDGISGLVDKVTGGAGDLMDKVAGGNGDNADANAGEEKKSGGGLGDLLDTAKDKLGDLI